MTTRQLLVCACLLTAMPASAQLHSTPTIHNTDADPEPSISGDEAISIAKKEFGAVAYKWQVPQEELQLKAAKGNNEATYYPTAKLLYYSGKGSGKDGSARQAYKVELFGHEPERYRIYYVDAQTGSVLDIRDIRHHPVTGKALYALTRTATVTYKLQVSGNIPAGTSVKATENPERSASSLATGYVVTFLEDMQLYPNPAKDQLNLKFTAEKTGVQLVSITDAAGRLILEVPVEVRQGPNQLNLKLENFTSGTYFLRLGGNAAEKFQIAD